jgi:hypothetical protein
MDGNVPVGYQGSLFILQYVYSHTECAGYKLNITAEWLALLLCIGMSQFQILSQRPAVVTEVFIDFLSPFWRILGTHLTLDNVYFLPHLL